MPEELLAKILSDELCLLPQSQPIMGLRNSRVEAREYLTHFRDSAGQEYSTGFLLQSQQIPFNLRVALDMKCLETTFAALAQLPKNLPHLHFVNLEPNTLESDKFWEALPRWLEGLRISHEQVVMEFTEAQSIHDLDELKDFARRLREQGLRIAVDDLGSGVASLSHMARLAPDFIKADRSLVHQAHRRPYQAALLNALAHFAQAMRVGFIAEGIETPEELQAVIDADVPWGQGYVFGKPVLGIPELKEGA
ncbi:MAG TPA: EAL domain-containing protein [Holophagaceae bacterium]|nr:EAL domain-containing protein [Holophagaceae bacterium]